MCIYIYCNTKYLAEDADDARPLQAEDTAHTHTGSSLPTAAAYTETLCVHPRGSWTPCPCAALHLASCCPPRAPTPSYPVRCVCIHVRLLLTATLCTTLQHTARHCKTLQDAARHRNILQHTATHCNTLQHFATLCHTLQRSATYLLEIAALGGLQHIATCCNNYYTLQHAERHCNTLHQTVRHCNTLQHPATPCNTLQHTAKHSAQLCNTLQHTDRKLHC